MSKKVLISAIFMALLASSVGGVFTAQAATIYPYGGLICSPVTQQSVNSGDLVSFSAYYNSYSGSSQAGQLTWQAVGGSPSSGTGSYFSTRFYTSSIYTTQIITVTDGYQSSACTVSVSGGYTNPVVPSINLSANPSYLPAIVNNVLVTNTTTLSWNTAGANSCTASSNPAMSQWTGAISTNGSMVVTGINQTSYFVIDCVGNGGSARQGVFVSIVPTYTPTPTPYFYGYGNVTMNHSVTNVTRGGQGTSVTAYNGDVVQFTTTITTGSQGSMDLHVRDWLPQYMTYVTGSTRINGSYYGDGIATGTTNNSLAVMDMGPNQTDTITFQATLSGAPNQVLTNSVNVHVRGYTDQNRMSTVSVVGSYYPYPTPTVYPTPYVTPTPYISGQGLSLVQYGRDVTRGQSGQYSSVVAHGSDTVDVLVHVRNGSSSTLSNVFVTDMLPVGLNIIGNTTSLNNIVTADGITTSGLNIGTLYPGQESVVKFSVVVDPSVVPSWGQVDLFNTAQVRADTINTISSQLPVTLGGALSIAAISRVKTGPADSVLLALLVSVVVTGIAAMFMDFEKLGRKELNFFR